MCVLSRRLEYGNLERFWYYATFRLVSFIACAYPAATDCMHNNKPNLCQFLVDENFAVTIAIGQLVYHIPCVIILICYFIVFFEMRKLFKVRPGAKPRNLCWFLVWVLR